LETLRLPQPAVSINSRGARNNFAADPSVPLCLLVRLGKADRAAARRRTRAFEDQADGLRGSKSFNSLHDLYLTRHGVGCDQPFSQRKTVTH